MRTLNAQLGFTLLEIMVALAVFALAGAAVIKSTGEHLRSVSMLQDITFATYVANNQLTKANLMANRRWPPETDERGEVEMNNRTWYWQQQVVKTADDDLLQVSITVYEDEQLSQAITSVTTYMAKE
uniref:type II secretion system minor pseudopilin GspI n=1 Tax=Ningiella ruwaisensis TaxID=2364274 RepID=UPI00109F1BB9|nr:type II secretion system minor pseudopilin GspI [Ningiella ruwaisensis]